MFSFLAFCCRQLWRHAGSCENSTQGLNTEIFYYSFAALKTSLQKNSSHTSETKMFLTQFETKPFQFPNILPGRLNSCETFCFTEILLPKPCAKSASETRFPGGRMNWEKFVTTAIFFRQLLQAPPCFSIGVVSRT